MLNIEQILNDLYNSEIDFHLGFLWDGGWCYALYNSIAPLQIPIPEYEIQATGESDLQKVFGYVIKDAIEKYPNSEFAKKYK